jgi:hypothetical protein
LKRTHHSRVERNIRATRRGDPVIDAQEASFDFLAVCKAPVKIARISPSFVQHINNAILNSPRDTSKSTGFLNPRDRAVWGRLGGIGTGEKLTEKS